MKMFTLIVPRRITINRILEYSRNIDVTFVPIVRCQSNDVTVTINDISKKIKPAQHPEYVPRKYLLKEPTQDTLKHLRWMLQKDLLGQDIFLTGGPGFRRRNLALSFLELTGREVEFIALSRDTTEADLKQRREIEGGSSNYHDQSAVRAAKNGSVLILEGVEKAERNVLPILNNLLENREMHLEDGRFLVAAERYDKLLEEHSQEELDAWRLVRVSEDFRVIALGLPSTRYSGHPLDPPLRSRFQARHIPPPSYKEQLEVLKHLAPNADPSKISQLLSCCHALVSEEAVSLGLPDFPLDNLISAAPILDACPSISVYDIFYKFYPYKLFLGKEGTAAVESILDTFGVIDTSKGHRSSNGRIMKIEEGENTSLITLNKDGEQTIVNVPSGPGNLKISNDAHYVETHYQNKLLTDMILSHMSSDYCIIGPKGCGKSTLVEKFAENLNYQVEPIVLYQDMTSRDLIQQRTTKPNGDTVWIDSPLISAALNGKLAILDGIHRVHSSTLAILYRLVHDREIQLHDGKRLIRADRYEEIKSELNKTDEQMKESRIHRIHPSFRIIALAEPPVINSSSGQWLNSELLSLFNFHEMRPLQKSEEIHIIESKYGKPSEALMKIIELAHFLRSSKDPTLQSLAVSLSTRQLLRIAGRMHKFPSDDAYDAVHRACLARFLPAVPKQALEDIMKQLGIHPMNEKYDAGIECRIEDDTVTIGKTKVDRYKTSALTKVPDILFYDVPQHLMLLEVLLQDFVLGQNILLVGNQGVGKNKIIDRLLQVMNRPREYIQLHRDTTVQTLTLQTMVKDGVVVYEDSPLVQAVRLGHVLVIDEADKAPTHVTCVLKTLAENGEMILSDGRRIVPKLLSNFDDKFIPIHPDFRMIVLANRPGFPFLGNDFFGALGDLFSTHSVDNPSLENEVALLRHFGPDVDDKIINKLVKAFGELRSMADQGLVSYPYSTREVVNIVKHLQKFPNEPLAKVVKNVFDFDRYSPEVFEGLVTVLHKHGIPIGTSANNVALVKEFPLPALKFSGTWNVCGNRNTIPVQERFIKLKAPMYPERAIENLDKVEARSVLFTEIQSYWTIPMSELASVAAIAVSKGSQNDGSDDKIHVLTINPTTLCTMTPKSDKVDKIFIKNLINLNRYQQPKYSIVADKLRNVLIHEETSNSLLLVNPDTGSTQFIQLSSFFEAAGDKLSKALGNKTEDWKLKSDLLISHGQIVFYLPSSNKIEVLNLNNMNAYSMVLPFEIDSIVLTSHEKWLLQDTSKRTFVLEKSSESTPHPNVLIQIEKSDDQTKLLGTINSSGSESLNSEVLGKTLQQKIDAPNRLLATDSTYAGIVVGFPELNSDNEVYVWPRNGRVRTQDVVVDESQIIRVLSSNKVPSDVVGERGVTGVSNYLEVVDTVQKTIRYLPVPTASKVLPGIEWIYPRGLPVFIAPTSNHGLVTVDVAGEVRLWETLPSQIEKSLLEWKRSINTDDENLQITKERYSGLDTTAPKHGKVDPKNEPHVGGNTWAGGTGGRDTAGLGGKGGPYRLDAGHNVHQLSDEEKAAVPEHVKKAAREMGMKAFKQRLRDIKMSEYDHKLYAQFSDAVAKQVKTLRVILGSLQAKSKERQWLRHQTSGELDDTKLIEGLTGEKTIYRRRAEKEPEIGAPQLKPKRLKLVADVSGSMYRFNGYDGRLDRELEACVMVMEAFSGYEDKFQYDIVGHSGDEYKIKFVDHNQPPKDNKQRLEIIKTMHAHSQFCMSGDHTLEATQHAISTLAKEDTDESIVVVFSDANLERYGISPQKFGRLLVSMDDVNAYVIFIGSLGDQAERVIKKMPSGRAFICMDLKDIPRILQQIFAASVLNTKSS